LLLAPTILIYKGLGEPLRAPLVRSRRAIRSITFAGFARYGGSATIPLALRFAQLKIKN
jgi:hypothetical protein